ncbi:TIGR03087 family PEP-CTERM/XrtA system glycosyltransferase [Kordiimonas sp.]|uniref:TIGR03087 family PEP-CTERM/XrtA system glycosyltransferase n=1 Tax=Kordiimonas sp. TaxID=1970157 RepID=UPI003A950918
MARILFLAHRIPYPPNKGDKIRSWHIFEHLCKTHDVHLAFYVDDAKDIQYVPKLEGMAQSLSFEYVSKARQKRRIPLGLVRGLPLTLSAYPQKKLQAYCDDLLSGDDIDLVFLFSGAVAPLVLKPGQQMSVPVIADLVDVDSAKWQAYAKASGWPLRMLYRRESIKLAAYEKTVAQESFATVFVSECEAALFRQGLPDTVAQKVYGVGNGVNLTHFNPERFPPVRQGGTRVTFTGAMDYAPNVEAAQWFVRAVWPLVLAACPQAEFVIAGGPKNRDVDALADTEGVKVLGYVEDMAETIRDATVVVAPLLTARGIQNKVLEGMAMAKPVVVSPAALEGIEAESGRDIITAESPAAFADNIISLLADPDRREALGVNARAFVVRHHSWPHCLATLDRIVAAALGKGAML